MLNREKVIRFLEKEKLKNINIINFLENNEFIDAFQVGNSILAKAKSDNIWIYFSISAKEEFLQLLELLSEEDKYFATVEEWMIPYLTKTNLIEWDLKTWQFYLPDEINLPIPCAEFRELQISDAEFVYKNSDYKEFLSIDYIQERIEKGISSGLIINDQLTAWAITQDDGAIGFLHVVDKHRRNGFAYQIMLDMIRKLKRAGKIPITYIEDGNNKSVQLMKKIGFIEDKQLIWLKLA